MNLLKLESWPTVSGSRSLLPRNLSRRFLDTVVWGIKDQFNIRTGSLSCFRRGFPYLHHGADEHGQHAERKSEDVEKRDGSKSLLSGQDVVGTDAHVYCKRDQRDLGAETPWETEDRTWLAATFLHLETHQCWSTREDEGGDRSQVGKFTHDLQFILPDAFYLGLERRLPRVQL